MESRWGVSNRGSTWSFLFRDDTASWGKSRVDAEGVGAGKEGAELSKGATATMQTRDAAAWVKLVVAKGGRSRIIYYYLLYRGELK